MPTQERQNSTFNTFFKKKSSQDPSTKESHQSVKQLKIRVAFGVILTLITIVLQCVAFFTPHWKEVSAKSQSLQVGSIDALIRTEVLVYFNAVHRFTRHSYGLLHRCEYISNNATKLIKPNLDPNKQTKICSKNFLPSFEDNQFDQCHSLEYYQFCSKANEKRFNIDNDYLLATFDILSNSKQTRDLSSSCDCHYPEYVNACHILQYFALTFLFSTSILFGIFPFIKTSHNRLKVKCFGVLSSILAMIFMLTILLVALNYFQYEPAEYVKAIEKHYHASQIYKLSIDAKTALNHFLSNIQVETGYSTIIAWIAFIMSIIDGILIMLTCKIPIDSPFIDDPNTPTNAAKSQESQARRSLLPDHDFAPILPPEIVVNNSDEHTSIPRSYSKE
ncbi:unnamed protein product [Adineta ricciae]|uniref:Uncharacterized protein n=1 Tax=Adineta ricciae TaxID=249248 RepID=A0A814QPZ0_ADIRI|nr:unnamed protein product [Adineta ricciae]CAF1123075.1 unnamed protein product [Adineta ricciae]